MARRVKQRIWGCAKESSEEAIIMGFRLKGNSIICQGSLEQPKRLRDRHDLNGLGQESSRA